MWYRTNSADIPLRLAHAQDPALSGSIDPQVYRLIGSSPSQSAIYSPANDAVFMPNQGFNAYLNAGWPNEFASSNEGAHMVAQPGYRKVRKNLEQALTSRGLSGDEKRPLQTIYDAVGQAMDANLYGYVAARLPDLRTKNTEDQLEQALAHERIHRTQSKLGDGVVNHHLPDEDFGQMKFDNPYHERLYRSLLGKGYARNPAEIASEGAAHIGAGHGRDLFSEYGAEREEEDRRQYLWLHNYINFILQHHGEEAAKEMFQEAARRSPMALKALEHALGPWKSGKPHWTKKTDLIP